MESEATGVVALVRHARPEVDPSVPSTDWRLSAEGRAAAAGLGERLRPLRLDRLVASEEAKAAETASIAAGALGVPWDTAPGLHEHSRRSAGYLGADDFDAAMRGLFAGRPFGDETGDDACDRFEAALAGVTAAWPGERVAVVAHGTVMALYLARHLGVDGYETWRSLPLVGVAELS